MTTKILSLEIALTDLEEEYQAEISTSLKLGKDAKITLSLEEIPDWLVDGLMEKLSDEEVTSVFGLSDFTFLLTQDSYDLQKLGAKDKLSDYDTMLTVSVTYFPEEIEEKSDYQKKKEKKEVRNKSNEILDNVREAYLEAAEHLPHPQAEEEARQYLQRYIQDNFLSRYGMLSHSEAQILRYCQSLLKSMSS